MQNKVLYCPNCNKEMFICLDEWGRTPWHLHCDECKINIGIDKMPQLENVLQQYHKPHTYLEYYAGKPQLLIEGEKIIINYEE